MRIRRLQDRVAIRQVLRRDPRQMGRYHFGPSVSLHVPDIIFQTYVPIAPTRCFIGLDGTVKQKNLPIDPNRLNAIVRTEYRNFYFHRPM